MRPDDSNQSGTSTRNEELDHERALAGVLIEEFARTRAPDLREKVIVLHLDLVSHIARRFVRRGPLLDDLIQVGFIGLMKAIDRYDPARKAAFVAYAIPTIAGEMKRYLRDKEPLIHVPRQVQEQRLDVLRVTERLSQQLGRAPMDREIAAALGIDARRLREVRAGEQARPVSLDRVRPGGEEGVTLELGDVLASEDDALDRSEDRLILERAFDTLSPRQRAILYLLFYEDLSQAEIGARLGISQMQVSRLSRAALERLREGLTVGRAAP
jgi:RNA polymerase sigma-B factor